MAIGRLGQGCREEGFVGKSSSLLHFILSQIGVPALPPPTGYAVLLTILCMVYSSGLDGCTHSQFSYITL